MTTGPGLRIVAVRLVCRDVAATVAFYKSAFKCDPAPRHGDAEALLLGAQRLEFATTTARNAPSTAVSNSTAFQHCAIVVPDMRAAMKALDRVQDWTPISTHGPEKLPDSSGGVTAFKFRDPEGHPLELLEFPPDRWPAHWNQMLGHAGEKSPPFLGIDHSAITVADTITSVAFYKALGFTAATRQINRGAEQARLDALSDPVVVVTALTPPGGGPPHLELLCYRSPDVVVQEFADSDPLATTLLLGTGVGGPTDGKILSDPDGHSIRMQ